jgi:DNA-binding beta-propeller fold protein YncE
VIPAGATGPARPGRVIYVASSGQGADGTISPPNVAAYTIAPGGGLIPLGQPAPVGADPRGLVFTPDGRHAYVANGEDNAVYGFTVAASGELVPLGAPVATGGEFPFSVAMAPDGRSLYTPNLSGGTVSVFAIGRGGILRRIGDPVSTGAENPRNVALTPDGRFLFVSHGTPLDAIPDVLVTFPVRPGGSLGPALPPVPIGAAGTGMAVTPDGRFLYIACSTTDNVYGFAIGPGGRLTAVPGSPFPAPKTPEGVAMAPDGRHLYVTSVATRPVVSPDEAGLWAFTVGADGSLSLASQRDAAGPGPSVAVTPNGRNLYVANLFADTVAGFAIAPTTGVPAEVPGSPFAQGATPSLDSIVAAPNQGPMAAFSVRQRPAGEPTRFDASVSHDPDGSVARYDWDFGDGTVLRDGGPRPVHTYARPGDYRVRLVVSDNEGCSTVLVFTGHSTLCTGSDAAASARTVSVSR